MTITRKIEDKNLVVTVLNGRVSHNELLRSFDELPQIAYDASEIYELVINDNVFQSDICYEKNKKVINYAAYVFNKFKRAAISIVSTPGSGFGIAKQFAAGIANEKIDVSLFRTEASARNWIDEIRFLNNSINYDFQKQYSENPETCFELSKLSYENAKRFLDFTKYLFSQKHHGSASSVGILGLEEALKSYELLFSSLKNARQESLPSFLRSHPKKYNSIRALQQSSAIFDIVLELVNDSIDKNQDDPPSVISNILSEISSLANKRRIKKKPKKD